MEDLLCISQKFSFKFVSILFSMELFVRFFLFKNVINCLVCLYNLLYRAENMARKAAGEEPLPEEDPSNPIFKPVPEPSRLDSFLITNQISNYCNQVNGYSILQPYI